MWLTHCPMHPDELRGCPNVNGHVHSKSIKKRSIGNIFGIFKDDTRYFNTCVDVIYPKTKEFLIPLDTIRSYFIDRSQIVC